MLRSNSTTVSFGQSRFRISSRDTRLPWPRSSISKIWNCCSGRRTFRPLRCRSAVERPSSNGPKRTDVCIGAPQAREVSLHGLPRSSAFYHLFDRSKVARKSSPDNCSNGRIGPKSTHSPDLQSNGTGSGRLSEEIMTRFHGHKSSRYCSSNSFLPGPQR